MADMKPKGVGSGYGVQGTSASEKKGVFSKLKKMALGSTDKPSSMQKTNKATSGVQSHFNSNVPTDRINILKQAFSLPAYGADVNELLEILNDPSTSIAVKKSAVKGVLKNLAKDPELQNKYLQTTRLLYEKRSGGYSASDFGGQGALDVLWTVNAVLIKTGVQKSHLDGQALHMYYSKHPLMEGLLASDPSLLKECYAAYQSIKKSTPS